MVNLDTLLANDKAVVAITHPKTAAPLGATVTLYGPASETYRKARQAMADRRLAASAAGQPLDAAAIEANALELLIACVCGWDGLVEPSGEPTPCTPENVRKNLTNPGLYWFKDQVDAGVNTVGNFLEA